MGLRLTFGRITTSGVVTEYTSTHIQLPSSITAGPDGALWFTNDFNPPAILGRWTFHRKNHDDRCRHRIHRQWNQRSDRHHRRSRRRPMVWRRRDNSIGPIAAVPMAVVTPSSGIPGTSVTLNSEGYLPGEQVNVTYETGLSSPSSVSICITTAHSDGTFSCVGDIPSSESGALGSHKIKAKGMISLATAKTTFTLT